MKLLRQCPKGAKIFSAPVHGSTQSQLGPLPWAVEVWYDTLLHQSRLALCLSHSLCSVPLLIVWLDNQYSLIMVQLIIM